jgi:hypothetical protein
MPNPTPATETLLTPGRRRWIDALCALLIAAGVFGVYNANFRAISAADTFAARYLPFSILTNHTVVLDPVIDTVAQGRMPPRVHGQIGTAFWIMRGLHGHTVSNYPIVVPLLVAPLYLPAISYLNTHGWDPHRVDQVARLMEKLAASLIATTSVVLIFLLLRRRCTTRTAASLSLVYALGTTTWTISSQALWMHGLAQCLIVATLLLLTGPRTLVRVALVGLFCAVIPAIRQPDAILAAPMGLYGLWWAGRSRWLLIAAGLPPVLLLLAYNLVYVGPLSGGYALSVRPENYNDDVAEGVAGLLFSPVRGLFVFSPFLLFVPALFHWALRDRKMRVLTLTLAASVVIQVGLYALVDWRQGVCWGPRWLTEITPLLIWMLPPIVAGLSRSGRLLFGTACCAGIAIQAIGAFWYTGVNDALLMGGSGPERTRPMWEWRNAPFIAELAHPPAPADLLRRVRGNIDLIEVIDTPTPDADGSAILRREIDVAGWALADSRSPIDVAILVDGALVAGTTTFFTRPDVVQTLGEASPAGWRLRIPVDLLTTGKHQLAALVRTDSGAEPRLLRQRMFEIPPDTPAQEAARPLAHAARVAMERLAAHQQAAGYWLTAYTDSLTYERPRPELNTYLNAILIDLVGPAAADTPLAGMLVPARRYLSAQIETDGLVRYHGRPDAPTIGTLGCAITPDSDDTALVWRVAPAEDTGRQAMALDVVGRYRRSDGLYRTWLAEPAAYRCLDPGRDPNPADIGIQMHIFLWLEKADPPAARALCGALSPRAGDAGIWVYYADTPLIVILRQAGMQQAGCRLPFPAERLESQVAGQDVWLRAARQLRRVENHAAGTDTGATIGALLLEIAAGDFAVMHQTPPLLYHNDLTATVRRFYWSDDLGYALWLRLYHEWLGLNAPVACETADKGECGAE